ncbi:MAG: glycosyl hydrolase [Hamadaea sp.]|nr:glycosyl hydrolase [Hamadaea sp.]
MLTENVTGEAVWRDPGRAAEDRVTDLLSRMTLEEKVAQLGSAWVGATPALDVAPHQHEFADSTPDWAATVEHGLGQLTRPYGTAAVPVARGAALLARRQAEIVAANRFGIPALVHEECLVGFMTWGATAYPTPLAWGATFDPGLVQAMAQQIGAQMRAAGVHQGLAPVLDVVRDPRWGRTEETIGEDPYLVATVGTAYVRGLRAGGIVPTLKHFAGYSASRAGRNFAPVAVGRRELADVLLPPFELAIRDGGADSVMHSYAEIDGVPVAADPHLLTDVLRNDWGFTGTVVADYYGVTFLDTLHGIAGDPAAAAALALTAGVDVELPATRCYRELPDLVRRGAVPEALVDRAAARVLRQKIQLGLLDPDWRPHDTIPADLDPPQARDLARKLAEESVVLLANDGVLPVRDTVTKVAVVGPRADDTAGMLGCYSYPAHHAITGDLGIRVPTVAAALRGELPHAAVTVVPGEDAAGIADAVAAAREADVCVAVLGDRSGLFGRGTTGEGCDVEDLSLPGEQGRLLDELIATGTPVVLVLLSGRPYALGSYTGCAAIVQAFLPGEEGGAAVAGILTGRVEPTGRLPIGVPRTPGGQPAGYLAPRLAHRTDVSSVDPTPLFPFGHGLAYTHFGWSDIEPQGPVEAATDEPVPVSVTVRNDGERPGAEVVQLYLHDPLAQVTRPVQRLVGYARVALEPGEAVRVTFRFHPDMASFTGRDGDRVVEPGALDLRLGASSVDIRGRVSVRLTGTERTVGHDRTMITEVTCEPA